MADDLAIDAFRAMRLQQHGYRIWTKAIPAEITPWNRSGYYWNSIDSVECEVV